MLAKVGQTRTWRPECLRCDLRSSPLGISTPLPRVGWRLPPAVGEIEPEAFQVIVATSKASLHNGGDVWNSGWVVSDDLSVRYAGRPTASRERLWWQVRMRTTQDETSDWSEPAWWEAGLFDRADWAACWIRRAERERPMPDRAAYLMRRSFSLPAEAMAARVYASALGTYSLHINGSPIGDALLRPGWTDYHRRVQYQIVDVTEALHEGPNVIGALLAPGWFAGRNLFTCIGRRC